MRRLRGPALAASALLLLASCHHSAPSRAASHPPAVVQGAFDAIAVTGLSSNRTALVPPDLRRGLDPLLAARTVDQPGPLSDYGLDAPVATISYQLAPAAPITVTVGGTNFDRTLFYVRRAGDPRIYAVLADAVTPVLGLVGIDVAPPPG